MVIRRLAILLPLAVVAAMAVQAQPYLVKDIDSHSRKAGSWPFGIGSIGSTTYFFATTEAGTELWKTDGTERGTEIVRDIMPGAASSVDLRGWARYPAPVVGNRIVFPASDGRHGTEMWVSDGTREGTTMLADINPGITSTLLRAGPVMGSILYFHAVTPDTGAELWRTDGTAAGTRMVIDLNPGPASSTDFGSMITAYGSQLLFFGWDGNHSGLFTTDGTAEGTRFAASSTGFGGLLGEKLLFATRDYDADTWTLLKMDRIGGPAEVLHADFAGGPGSLLVSSGIAYFVANDGVSGAEIWRTDGTAAGTTLFADLTPGPNTSGPGMGELNGRLLIRTDRRLWISDGTAADMQLLSTGAFSTGCVSGSHYYFTLIRKNGGLDLWRTDGSVEGTTLVADLVSDGGAIDGLLIPRDDGIFFAAAYGESGYEPWISDGTRTGTRGVKVIAPRRTFGSYPHSLANIGGKLFFRAQSDAGRNFSATWISDGTAEGTTQLGSVTDNDISVAPGCASGGFYYFAKRTWNETELWKTDGTRAGTTRLAGLGHMTEDRFGMRPFRNGVLFWGGHGDGVALGFTDGTAAGTSLFAGVSLSYGGNYAERLLVEVLDGVAFFGNESEIFRTDGTIAGTRRFSKELEGPWRSPRAFTRVGEWVFFVASPNTGRVRAFDLWRTNLNSGERFLVRTFDGHDAPLELTNVGGTLLFVQGNELWRSDGTYGGTMKVRDGVPTPVFWRGGLAAGNGLLFWYAFAGDVAELWRSDGTAAGTFRLRAFDSLPAPGANLDLHFSGGLLFFRGSDPLHGNEPWVSDGTAGKTRLLADISPGPENSDPESFLRIGDTLFVSADREDVGRELWGIPIRCGGDCPPRRRGAGH